MAGTLTIGTLSDGTNSTSATNAIQGSAKAWVNFNGVTTTTIRASYNVSSVTRNGTGDYTVNFTNALADVNFSPSCLGSTTAGGAATNGAVCIEFLAAGPALSRTTTSFRFYSLGSSWTNQDAYSLNVAVFR